MGKVSITEAGAKALKHIAEYNAQGYGSLVSGPAVLKLARDGYAVKDEISELGNKRGWWLTAEGVIAHGAMVRAAEPVAPADLAAEIGACVEFYNRESGIRHQGTITRVTCELGPWSFVVATADGDQAIVSPAEVLIIAEPATEDAAPEIAMVLPGAYHVCEPSYSHVISSHAGVTKGTCKCGAGVFQSDVHSRDFVTEEEIIAIGLDNHCSNGRCANCEACRLAIARYLADDPFGAKVTVGGKRDSGAFRFPVAETAQAFADRANAHMAQVFDSPDYETYGGPAFLEARDDLMYAIGDAFPGVDRVRVVQVLKAHGFKIAVSVAVRAVRAAMATEAQEHRARQANAKRTVELNIACTVRRPLRKIKSTSLTRSRRQGAR